MLQRHLLKIILKNFEMTIFLKIIEIFIITIDLIHLTECNFIKESCSIDFYRQGNWVVSVESIRM